MLIKPPVIRAALMLVSRDTWISGAKAQSLTFRLFSFIPGLQFLLDEVRHFSPLFPSI